MTRFLFDSKPTRAIISCFLFGVCLTACSKFYSADRYVEEAKNYEKKGDNKSALIQLKNALQKNPDHTNARILLGDLYLHLGDGPSAENEYRKALNLGASKDLVLIKIAHALSMQGKFKMLLDETEPVTNAALTPEMLTVRGDALTILKDKQHANEAFDLALKEQPNYPPALIGMAKLALVENNLEAANRYANQATSANPNDVESWLFKGKLLQFEGQPNDALNAYSTALKLQPDSVSALVAKANVEISTKQFAEARADLQTAIKLSPKNILANYQQAELDYFEGKNARAIESLEQLRKFAPRFLPAILLSGAVNMALGSPSQAEVFLIKYLEEMPNNIFALKLLARCQLNDGNPQLALETLEKALKNSNGKDSQLFSLLGEAALRTQNYRKGDDYFNQAIALAPTNPEFYTKLAINNLFKGNDPDAIKELEHAISLGDKNNTPKSTLILTMTYLKQHEVDKALETSRLLEQEQPTSPMVANIIGNIYLEKKDPDNARISYNKSLQLQPNYFPAVANLAMMDVSDKKFDEAKNRFLAILKTDKSNLDAQLELAKLSGMQGKNDDAKKWLQQASTDHTDNILAGSALVDFYVNTRDDQKALTVARNLRSSHPDSADYLQLLARTQQATNDRQGAIDSLTKLAALHPESASDQLQVAVAYIQAGDDANASEVLKKTLIIDSDYYNAQIILADLESRHADYDSALHIARLLQSRDGRKADSFILEGNIEMRQKDFGAAARSFDTALRLKKRNDLLIKLHDALVQNKKEKEANEKILAWLKENPADNITRVYYATYLLSSQKSKAASIEQFLAALKYEPKNAMILNNLAWAYAQENNPQALSYAQQANQIASNDPQIMDTYGWILARKGDYAGALPLLQKSAKLMPQEGEIHYHYAYALNSSGNKTQARKELEQIINGKEFPSMGDAKNLFKQLSS